MQFTCNQDTFSKYLNIISRVVSNKPGLPILNNVQFETSKGKLIMTATDLEIGINTWIGADVKSEGKVTVPAKQLTEFVNSIPSEKVDVEIDGQNFNISSTNNSAIFNTMSSEDFPSVNKKSFRSFDSISGAESILKLRTSNPESSRSFCAKRLLIARG